MKRSMIESYYEAVLQQDLEKVSSFLHPKISFKSPFAQISGKEAVLEAIKGFAEVAEQITFRQVMGGDEQEMAAYDLKVKGSEQSNPAAILIQKNEGLIYQLELFFDSLPYKQEVVDRVYN